MKKFFKRFLLIITLILSIYIGYISYLEYLDMKDQINNITIHTKVNTILIKEIRNLTKYYIAKIETSPIIKEESTSEYYQKRTVVLSCELGDFCSGVVLSKHLILTCKHCALVQSEKEFLL